MYWLSQKDRPVLSCVWLHIHVTGFEIQSRNCPLRFSYCRQSKAVSEAAAFSLSIPQALSGSQPSSQICEERYSVVALFWDFFIIHHRTNVCQYFLNKFLNIFQKSGDTILFYALRSEIETDSHFIMSLKPLITTYKNRKLEVEKAWFQAISKA